MDERVVESEEAGERFDRWVARVTGLSRQRAMKLFAEGRIRVDGKVGRKGDTVEAGWRVTIERPGSESPVPESDSPLAVLYEDEHLLAIDKPAGMSMHPLRPGEKGMLANSVAARFPDVLAASPEERCPGLVHRLDHDTSGVVLWARRREVWDSLREQFSSQTVTKRYLALVQGTLEGEGELTTPLAHHPKDPRRMIAVSNPETGEALKAREALTRYRVLASSRTSVDSGGRTGMVAMEGQPTPVDGERTAKEAMLSESPCTLVEVHIVTGVRHQIRVHLSSLGHPVVGDVLYGGPKVPEMQRHWLHAQSIGFEHPATGRPMTLSAPVPEELQNVLARAGITKQ